MACYVRRMYKDDIPPVLEIDREAFPTQWPPPNFQHELRNRLAHYLVACDSDRPVEAVEVVKRRPGFISGLRYRLRRLFSRENKRADSPDHYITGYVGFWYLPDEAHITSIAVRGKLQRQGIGELLLISSIQAAMDMEARTVTLEVRVSNTGAQALYQKYGFNKMGIRKGYYTDNREDAIIMTTDDINSAAYRERFESLKQAYLEKQTRLAERRSAQQTNRPR